MLVILTHHKEDSKNWEGSKSDHKPQDEEHVEIDGERTHDRRQHRHYHGHTKGPLPADPTKYITWWRHQMEIFSALLAICAGNSPVTGEFPAHKGKWRRALMFSLICAWINGWVNTREAGDLRRHRTHCDVTVMMSDTCVILVIMFDFHLTKLQLSRKCSLCCNRKFETFYLCFEIYSNSISEQIYNFMIISQEICMQIYHILLGYFLVPVVLPIFCRIVSLTLDNRTIAPAPLKQP